MIIKHDDALLAEISDGTRFECKAIGEYAGAGRLFAVVSRVLKQGITFPMEPGIELKLYKSDILAINGINVYTGEPVDYTTIGLEEPNDD